MNLNNENTKTNVKPRKMGYYTIAGMLISCVYIVGNALKINLTLVSSVVIPIVMIITFILTVLRNKR